MDPGTRAWSMGGLMTPGLIGTEGRTAKLSAAITVVWNVAQAIASVVVLSMEWGQHCDQRLSLWLLIATGRIIVRLGLCAMAYKYHLQEQAERRERRRSSEVEQEEEDEEQGTGGATGRNSPGAGQSPSSVASERLGMIDKMKEVLDVFHLVWFTLGNAWTFGSRTCRLTAPLTFYLSLTIIVVTYAVMLFPILLAVLLIPFACFCLPCVLRVLVRLREADNQRGTPRAVIDQLPSGKYQEGMFECADDATCPICLTEYEDGDMLRILQCSGAHHFHLECIDQWLQLQAVCPCCREPPTGNTPTGEAGRPADAPASAGGRLRSGSFSSAFSPGASSSTASPGAAAAGGQGSITSPLDSSAGSRSAAGLLPTHHVPSQQQPQPTQPASLRGPQRSLQQQRESPARGRGLGLFMLFSLLRPGSARAGEDSDGTGGRRRRRRQPDGGQPVAQPEQPQPEQPQQQQQPSSAPAAAAGGSQEMVGRGRSRQGAGRRQPPPPPAVESGGQGGAGPPPPTGPAAAAASAVPPVFLAGPLDRVQQ